jgi:Spy/CpxP family protein refolding chaperone
MIKHTLLVLPMAAVLALGLAAAGYGAGDNLGGPSGPPMMKSGPGDNPAGPWAFARPGHRRATLEAIQKKLGISDDQKKQMRALQVTYRDRTRKARMDLASFRDEKKTMMLSGKIDQQKLAQIDDQIVKLRGDLMRERLKLRRDRLSLLTPEQIGRLVDWQAERGFRARMHKGRWGRAHGWRGGIEG